MQRKKNSSFISKRNSYLTPQSQRVFELFKAPLTSKTITPLTSKVFLSSKEKPLIQSELGLEFKLENKPLTRERAWLSNGLKVMDSADAIVVELGRAKNPIAKYKELLRSGKLAALTTPRDRLMLIKAIWHKLPAKKRPKIRPNSTLAEIELALLGNTSVPGELVKQAEQPQLPNMPSPHQLMLERQKLIEKRNHLK